MHPGYNQCVWGERVHRPEAAGRGRQENSSGKERARLPKSKRTKQEGQHISRAVLPRPRLQSD